MSAHVIFVSYRCRTAISGWSPRCASSSPGWSATPRRRGRSPAL